MDAAPERELPPLDALLREHAEREPNPTDERILDGALEAIAACGPARATVDDIARTAGVGRVTVFRRFGSKDQVLHHLRRREVAAFLAEAASAWTPSPTGPNGSSKHSSCACAPRSATRGPAG